MRAHRDVPDDVRRAEVAAAVRRAEELAAAEPPPPVAPPTLSRWPGAPAPEVDPPEELLVTCGPAWSFETRPPTLADVIAWLDEQPEGPGEPRPRVASLVEARRLIEAWLAGDDSAATLQAARVWLERAP